MSHYLGDSERHTEDVVQSVKYCLAHTGPEFNLQNNIMLGVAAHTCNSSTEEVEEVGGSVSSRSSLATRIWEAQPKERREEKGRKNGPMTDRWHVTNRENVCSVPW